MSTRIVLAVTALMVALVALAGCSSPAFDASGPCTTDGSAPGAYPDLEAQIPPSFQGASPERLDSGRNCTQTALGTLWTDGLRELKFAGGVWKTGAESGVTLALFHAPGLTASKVETFFEAGARTAPKTGDLRTTTPTIDGAQAYRLDLSNGGYLQSIVSLPGPATDDVRVVLVSSAPREVADQAAHDATVATALETFTGAAGS